MDLIKKALIGALFFVETEYNLTEKSLYLHTF